MIYSILADIIVFIHLLYVAFAVGGELVILAGWIFRWQWIRNIPFRITHLAAVVLVAIEALSGIMCPLTVWEYDLRILSGQLVERDITFIGQLIRMVIFYDFPDWVFTLMYVGFAAVVMLTIILIPPKRKYKKEL